jgi:hypothetical protein
MDLQETEARNDCAGEGQQQFNRPTDLEKDEQRIRKSVLACDDEWWPVVARSSGREEL